MHTFRGVDVQFTSQDLTVTLEEFSDRYLKPAAKFLATHPKFTTLYWDRGAYRAYKPRPLDLSLITGPIPTG